MHTIEYLLEDAKTKLKHVSHAIEVSENEVTFLRNNKLCIDANIQEAFNNLVETLHERANFLRKQAYNISEAKYAQLTKHISSLRSLASDLEDCLHLGRSAANNPALRQAINKALEKANSVSLSLPETGDLQLIAEDQSLQDEINDFGFVEVKKQVPCAEIKEPDELSESDDGISIVANEYEMQPVQVNSTTADLLVTEVEECPLPINTSPNDYQNESISTASEENPWLVSSKKAKMETEVQTMDLAINDIAQWVRKELPPPASNAMPEKSVADQSNNWLMGQQKQQDQDEKIQWVKINRPIKKATHTTENSKAQKEAKTKEEWLVKTDEMIMEICADVEDLCLDKQNEEKVASWLINCNDFEPAKKKRCTNSAFGSQDSLDSYGKGFVKLINRHVEDDRSWLLYPQTEVEGSFCSTNPTYMDACSDDLAVGMKSEEVAPAANDGNWVSVTPRLNGAGGSGYSDTYASNLSDVTDSGDTNSSSNSFQSVLDHMRSIRDGDSSQYLIRPPVKQVTPEEDELLCNWLAGRADSRCGDCPSKCSYDRATKSQKWYKTVSNW